MAPMVEVQSSMLSHVGYSQVDRVLNIRFCNSTFVHPSLDVPPEVHAELMAAESIGQAYNRLIRGKFTAGSPVQIDDEDGSIVTTAGEKVDLRAPWPLPVEV